MKIPETLEECYIELDKNVVFSNNCSNMSEDEAMLWSHFSFGMWIRNNWGLWVGSKLSKWFNTNGINHPDDMSDIILKSYYRYKNNKDVRLEEQFNETIEFYLTDKQKLLRQRKKKLKILSQKN